MNNVIVDKIKFDELITKYMLEPSLVDVYVEGTDDETFYKYHSDNMGLNLRFVDISTIDFDKDLTLLNLENNNRDRIIYLLSELNEKVPKNKVYGIIDKDIIKYTRGFDSLPKNVFTTDFSCLEMYYLCERNINKIRIQTFHFVTMEEINNLLNYSANFAHIIIVEKKLNLSITKISFDKLYQYVDFVNIKVKLENYIQGCLSVSNLSKKYNCFIEQLDIIREKLSSEDPSLFINGHVFMNILTGYISKNKKFKQIKQEEVCNIYKTSVETSFLEEFDLFTKLKSINKIVEKNNS